MCKNISIFGLILAAVFASAHSFAAMDQWTESYRLESIIQYDAAVKTMDAIINKEPSNDFAILRRGWLNYLRGKHDSAISDYKKALKVNNQSLDAKLDVILPLLAQQRWNEAAKFSNEVLKVAPWNYYAHVRLMIAEEGQKRWKTLAKHADEVYRRYPSDATVLVYLARAQRWSGNIKAARSAYLKVLKRIPGHIEASQYLLESM